MSSDQREYRIAVCTKLKEQAEYNPNFISNIITGDISWVLEFYPEMKQWSSHWKTPTLPQLKKAWQVWSNVKSIFISFSDIEGTVNREFVPPGQTVNEKFYCDILRWLRENFRARVQTSDATTPGPYIMTMLQLMLLSLCGCFWLLCTWQSSPPSLLTGPHTLWFFPIPTDEIEGQGAMF
jgi:Transposase.